jgi:hypothetical protein
MRRSSLRRSLLVGTILGAMAMPGAVLAATNAQRVGAIDNGLAWLATQQNPDGSWSYGGYDQAMTGAAVDAFLSQKGLWGSNAAAYQAKVDAGIGYLLGNATTTSITNRLDGLPACPGGGSCTGVYWYGNGETTYTTGLISSAMAQYGAAKGAGTVAATSGPLAGMTWGQISQGVINTFTAGQSVASSGDRRGGWRYFPGTNDSDGSTTQWAVISNIFGATLGGQTPPIVKDELKNYWLVNDQAGDGSGCYQPGNLCEFSDTGSLLLGLSFVGKGTSDPQVQAALGWLNTNWTQNSDGGWYGNFGNPYAM